MNESSFYFLLLIVLYTQRYRERAKYITKRKEVIRYCFNKSVSVMVHLRHFISKFIMVSEMYCTHMQRV